MNAGHEKTTRPEAKRRIIRKMFRLILLAACVIIFVGSAIALLWFARISTTDGESVISKPTYSKTLPDGFLKKIAVAPVDGKYHLDDCAANVLCHSLLENSIPRQSYDSTATIRSVFSGGEFKNYIQVSLDGSRAALIYGPGAPTDEPASRSLQHLSLVVIRDYGYGHGTTMTFYPLPKGASSFIADDDIAATGWFGSVFLFSLYMHEGVGQNEREGTSLYSLDLRTETLRLIDKVEHKESRFTGETLRVRALNPVSDRFPEDQKISVIRTSHAFKDHAPDYGYDAYLKVMSIDGQNEKTILTASPITTINYADCDSQKPNEVCYEVEYCWRDVSSRVGLFPLSPLRFPEKIQSNHLMSCQKPIKKSYIDY